MLVKVVEACFPVKVRPGDTFGSSRPQGRKMQFAR